MREDSQRVRVLMERKIAQSRELMKAVTFERTISRDDMERFLSEVVVDDLGMTFARIASEFVQRRSDVERQVSELIEQSPLMATISQSIIAEKHVAAKVGSVEDDPFGRLIQQAAQGMSLADIWLVRALDRTLEVHKPRPGHFASWAARTGLFDDLTFLVEGIAAWYDEDFLKAVHVLVPQVEAGLRAIVSKLGKPVTKPHPTVPDVSVAIGMGDILYSKGITAVLGPDITLHFLTLYADPRGFNLRNDIAHGLLRADSMHFALASRVIHTLLLLGVWKELAEARKAATTDAREG
jgi:lysyl-tRNA synthetase class 1